MRAASALLAVALLGGVAWAFTRNKSESTASIENAGSQDERDNWQLNLVEVPLLPKGIRNNNPLNIRENAQADFDWQGEALQDFDPDFEEFVSMVYGLRAAFVILRNYRDKHGLTTIEGIITRWAPPNENDTERYIEFVSEQTGIARGVPLFEWQYVPVVKAMAIMENGWPEGGEWFSDQDAERGAQLAGI